MLNVRLVIFDLDGTLVDAYPAITSSFNATLKQLGYSAQKSAVIRRAVGWGDKNLLKPFVKEADLEKALLFYRQRHKKDLVLRSRLFPQTLKVLTYLKNKGYKLAIASNRPTRFCWILIRHLKLDKHLDLVLCADRLKHGKPHPEILNKIMRKFKVKPDQTVFIGDMFVDAQAGRRAKVRSIMLPTGSSSKEELEAEYPFCIINNLNALMKLL